MTIRFVCPKCWTVREDLDESRLGDMVKCNECHAMSVAAHTPDPNRRRRKPKGQAPPAARIMPVGMAVLVEETPPSKVVLCTGDYPGEYEVVDLVCAQAMSPPAQAEGLGFADVVQTVKNRLAEEARQVAADAVINVRVEFASARTGVDQPRAFEVFACGTAVKLRPITASQKGP
jgi:Putative heavy-metal-binding